MLIISRKNGQTTTLTFDPIKELIDTDPEAAKELLSDVTITVVRVKGNRAFIGIDAASEVGVLRGELERINTKEAA